MIDVKKLRYKNMQTVLLYFILVRSYDTWTPEFFKRQYLENRCR